MKHIDMRLDNAKTIFYLVFSGKSTLTEITESIDLSRQAIKNICLQFTKCSVFNLESLKRASSGRPEYAFSVSKEFYSAYVIQDGKRVDVIFINAFSDVLDRFDYCFKKDLSNEENFKNAMNLILNHPKSSYCTDIFITCQDKFKQYLPEFVKLANSTEMIINAYKSENEIIVFKFSNEIYISFYGNIVHTSATINEIKKVINIDKLIRFKKDDIIMEVINSLQHITIENMIKRIQ